MRIDATAESELTELGTLSLSGRSGSYLCAMLDRVTDGVAMFDIEECLIAWNRPFPELLGPPEGLSRSRCHFAAA